ncbi:helix-turn-helix transcriptional regulator [Streptosporangium roseum]|uniref:Transcriptional regulator, XRE family n=1 Tax=Streptosporangium roseum (strain ATCC 12428 / DSM 43021 / JCM 3005 / KCTC 9067 / NCIMB 10171 / NRRL 2505 / NI 9100) TaxID=479432 RepID=D2B6C4_STRRD|nr:helix-turn-helix transcriptional regulator [Streptosporangium roseum]ACZ83837.1 putative transcriptional regulator, XRE family [Streptosporangium roseum DSM 43021]
MSDNELGTYLRTRREAVRPADVGLPDGVRRRTPGLRRSELATLAGVSVEYLARLEQGRDRRPSVQVLAALADALRLPPEERLHIRRLAKMTSGDHLLCPASTEPPDRSVRPTVRSLLDRLEPAPAVLLNRLGDVLAFTTGYERLAGPIGLLDAEQPNLIRFVFTDARARTAYPEWDRVADEHAANLKIESSTADPYTAELVDELTITAGAPFSDRLAAPTGFRGSAGVERLVHPEAGRLRLTYEILELPDTGRRLVVYLPDDDATSAALDHLTGRQPGALRVVAG